ncbi:CAP domain-containing protein [Pseudoduganella sp. LjRoot289]|uniref:CAP domain-containing protein n=1 Tax=Pseudoduganella sp. LjRoot289 TaxID=3342314 RepID=UPI003ECC24A4
MNTPHRWNTSLWALVLAALLSGCGGGGGGSTAGVTPVTPSSTLPTEPGAPTLTGNAALDGYNWINYRRQLTGLTSLARNALLDKAALDHSNYQRINNTITHDEISGRPGFTGATLEARLQAAGYQLVRPFAFGEVISAASDTSGFYHAEELITAIYHRFVIFEPVFREVGAGTAAGNGYTYFTADFAASGGYGPGVGRGKLAVYPAASQSRVALNFFSDSESPDPVPNQNEVGYPISVHADISSVISVQSFTVRPRGGNDLSVRLLARASDKETPPSVAAIVPLNVLKGATVYDVTFAGTVDGVQANRSWSFTTK